MPQDGYIQVPPDSTGKKLDATTVSIASEDRYRERMQIAGTASASLMEVTNADPLTTDFGGVTRNIPFGTQSVKQVEPITVSGTISVAGGTVSISGTASITGTVNQGTPGQVTAPWLFRANDGGANYELPPRQSSSATLVPSGVNILAQFDDVATANPAENQSAILRITGARGLHISPRSDAGSEIFAQGSPGYVSGTVSSNVGTGTWSIGGDVAHDTADAGRPVKIGGQAQSNSWPAAVADADRVNALFDTVGRQLIMPWADRSNWFQAVLIKSTTNSEQVIATPGAGTQSCVTSLELSNRSTTANTYVVLFDGTTTTFSSYFLASAGGGVGISFPVPKTLSGNASMTVTMSAAADVFIGVSGFKQPTAI